MNTLKQRSLGDQVSNKISIWILTLVVVITAAVFLVSFLQSRQMFLKQVSSWRTVIPQQALTSLIDSDYFSIQREGNFLQSTGLFSSFSITDNQKKIIASFGDDKMSGKNLLPIQDDAKVIWGYYFFTTDFYEFFLPFLIFGAVFLALIVLLYFFIRWRIRSSLNVEFFRFNQFLNEIELLTEKIHEIYHVENVMIADVNNSYHTEQVIINRAIFKLLSEIKKANQSLREAVSLAEQKRFQDELTATALQVVHDIGSSLAVLEAIVQSASLMLPEESRVALRNVAIKIRDIVNSLLKKAKHDLLSLDNGMLSQQLLSSLIHQVVTEKRLQYRENERINIHFDFNACSYGLFSLIKAADFSRVLSNLINNSIEALISAQGDILISLIDSDNEAVIQIKDNGRGIASDHLVRLGKMGVTYGKANGHGLGLFHAKTTIENLGGRLNIQSQAGKGTLVKIHLPKTKPPVWFVPEITISSDDIVVIIDDDESIHEVWRQRFRVFQDQPKLMHFFSPEEFMKWNETGAKVEGCLFYLCDYEFIGSTENGISLITKLRLNYLSILVTSRFYLDDVIIACEAAGIKLLPKDMANFVPINVVKTR